MNVQPSTISAQSVSRALRKAGFMPSQPSSVDPFPALQVKRGSGYVMVIVRHTRTLHPSDVCAALEEANYKTATRMDSVDPAWSSVRVWK